MKIALTPYDCAVNGIYEHHCRYPARFPVDSDKVSWNISYPGYNPSVCEGDQMLKGLSSSKPWGRPSSFKDPLSKKNKLNDERWETYKNYPRNPYGRTGIVGRGVLKNFGYNYAAFALITTTNERDEKEVLLITRKDCMEIALPGDLVGSMDSPLLAVACRLEEDTDIQIEGELRIIYEGYLNDPRNTDIAWIEAKIFHGHLDKKVLPQAGGNALDAFWLTINEQLLENMYTTHSEILRAALEQIDF